LIVIAAAYLFLVQAIAIFTIPAGAIIVILGLIVSPRTGVTGKGQGGASPMVVDRAILGASIYQLFFFDTRLILKRLATSRTTILAIVALAVAGFTIDRLIGALAGVAAGYAIQEFTTQSNRLKGSVSNTNFKLGNGDIEVPYSELEKVQLNKNKLVLYSKRGITRIGLPRGYEAGMSPDFRLLFPGKFKDEELVHSANASREQNE
jgi:hypothetical protein